MIRIILCKVNIHNWHLYNDNKNEINRYGTLFTNKLRKCKRCTKTQREVYSDDFYDGIVYWWENK